MTLLIWAIEAGVWMSTGAAVGFHMDPIEGLYLVALASVFSMIPSGPAYAGTQDAAVIVGIKALGGTGSTALALPADAALRDRRADHAPGPDPAGRPLRRTVETARRARRGEELTMTDVAAPSETTTPERPRPAAPAQRRRVVRGAGHARAAGLGRADRVGLIVRFIALGERAFHHDESQDAYFSYLFRQIGDYEYNPLLHGPLRFYLTALMYVLFGDTDFTARLAPALMGAAMIPLCWALRPLLGRDRARSPPRCCSRSARATCTSRASPARTSTSPASRSR